MVSPLGAMALTVSDPKVQIQSNYYFNSLPDGTSVGSYTVLFAIIANTESELSTLKLNLFPLYKDVGKMLFLYEQPFASLLFFQGCITWSAKSDLYLNSISQKKLWRL